MVVGVSRDRDPDRGLPESTMSEVAYVRWGGGKPEAREVDHSAFGTKVRRRVLFDAVLMYEANRRVGTASTKGRGEVAGTSRKPFAQKHTGRARVGTLQATQRRGGGISGGPKPRDWSYSMPRKARKAALASAILSKFQDDEVVIVDRFALDRPSTKEVAQFLRGLGREGSCLLVSAERDDRLLLSARNLPRVAVRPALELNAYDVLRYRHLILAEDAFSVLKERMSHAES